MSAEELDRLIQSYLDEAITEEGARRLNQLLKAGPGALDRFVRAVDLHGVLSGLRSERAEEALPGDGLRPRVHRPATRRSTHRRFGSDDRSARVAAVSAAGVLVVLGLFFAFGRTSVDPGGVRADREARARRDGLQSEQARAEQERRRAEAQLREIERRREELARPPTPAAPDPVVEERRKKDLALLDSEKERVEREMREAIDQARQVREELARIPEMPPDPPKAVELPRPRPDTQAAVATIERVEGEGRVLQETGNVPARAGQELRPGHGLEIGGRAVLMFGDQTQVELGPATVVRDLVAEGGKRFFVEKGSIAAVVTRQPPGRPMVIATPHGECRVLGTTLRVLVEPGDKGSTRLDVDEGKVQLTRKSDGKGVPVESGHFAVAAVGVELSAKPFPADEIVLPARNGRLVGGEWARVPDPDAAGGTALESRERTPEEGKLRLRNRTLGYAEFTFLADARRDYRVWIRGRCVAPQEPTAHDFLVIAPATEATFTGLNTPEERAYWENNSRDINLMSGHLNGWGLRKGYFWVGGNTDQLGALQETEYAPVYVRFTNPGRQTLRVYAFEGPMRFDLVWLSATRKTRPADGQTGPVGK